MAEINAPCLEIIGLFGAVSFAFLTFHTYKYDGFRCLIPRQKVWFRCLLIYMLVISNMCFLTWAWGWAYVKIQLGMVRFGPTGARPWPSALFPARFQNFNPPLTVLFGICYGLQACLTVEEALYFYHLMRCVRRPQAAVPFLKSIYFKVWVAVSIIIMGIQQAVPWIGHDGELEIQLSTELLAGGLIEIGMLTVSAIVVLKFPKFLKDIEGLGVGPDVRVRLHTYHALNKIRTFFRLTFSVPQSNDDQYEPPRDRFPRVDNRRLAQYGHDDLHRVNMNPLATDFLASIIGGSLSMVMMISIVLYLPRSPPSAQQNQVMVGRTGSQGAQGASAFALISLLREGGQWEGLDDDITPAGIADKADRRLSRIDNVPFADGKFRKPDGEGGWLDIERAAPKVPKMLADFSSPIAVSTEAQAQGPIRIQMHVERDIHADEGGEAFMLSPPRVNRD